jgi:Bax protein
MQSSAIKNLSGFILLAYAVACLMLVGYLSHFSLLKDDGQLEISDLMTSTALPDFSSFEQPRERKQAFIEMLLPLIEEKNIAVMNTRNLVLKMQKQLNDNNELTDKQIKLLERLRERYHVSHDMYPEVAEAINILLLRVDIIPASMVLAQAAVESGWGTSRFAVEAHNLFGQWCYTPGCGLIPERRPASARHEVQLFGSVEESLSAYYRNINTHNAYRYLRQLRAQLRTQDGGLTGDALVAGLAKYSGRGPVYIDELLTVIRINDLENWEASPVSVAMQP